MGIRSFIHRLTAPSPKRSILIDAELIEAWLTSGQKKICVKGNDAEHLLQLEKQCKERDITTVKIHDAGHTQIPSGSLTVLSLGPDMETNLDKITGDLKLL